MNMSLLRVMLPNLIIMPMLLHDKVCAFGQTDQGLMRSDNEDSFLISEKQRVYAVADGLGGLPEGSMASELAAEALSDCLANVAAGAVLDFEPLFATINQRVFARGQEVSSEMGIGTTLTVAQLCQNCLHIGHVGDSGLAIFNRQTWRQITRDHTMAQDMLDRLQPGEHAFIPDYFSHTLTRCIGQLSKIEVDTYTCPLEPGDRVLLYTDGVTKTMEFDELHQRVLVADQPQQFVSEIIHTANERGGPDNITAIALFFD